ncbi:MAG: DNA polymerase III subunit delta [Oscillospiraceae bacterium]|nr:DNA polymerase III subunit delta [Oscillospiraceae bacterium]
MAKKPTQTNALQELKAAIRAKSVERLYFFHGEETFLLHHYLDQLRKLLLDELTESFNFHKLNAETFGLQALADAVENLPMMAEHTLVWVDEIDIFKLSEVDRNKLTEILSDVPDYCTLVFTYISTPWKPDKRLKKLWEAVDKHGTVVEFAKQEQRDLVPWIGRHFAARKKQISTDLCVYLIDITGGTMTALAGEIDKICAYSGADRIVKSDIDAVVEPVLDAVVFQMTDLLGQGEYGPALVKLRTLLKMQQEPIAILGAIGGHFRRLGTARTLLDNGRNSSELMKLCAMGDYPARKTMSAAGRFSSRFCAKAAELVMETDYQMKTSFDDQDRLLEMLVLRLAQEARNG